MTRVALKARRRDTDGRRVRTPSIRSGPRHVLEAAPVAIRRSSARLAAALVVLSFVAMSPTARAAATPTAAKGATGETSDAFSYSDLRAAIRDRSVKSATLRPADFEVQVVLKDGSKHKVGYPPTDEALADELSAAGAKVDVDTDFGGSGFPWSGLMLLGGIGAMIAAMFFLQRQQAKAAARRRTSSPRTRRSRVSSRRCGSPTSPAATRPCRRPPSSSSSSRRPEAYRRLGAKMPSGPDALRTSRHRQDAAREGRRGRGGRRVLRDVRLGLRRDVRRRRRRAASATSSPRPAEHPGDHLHRRGRRRSAPSAAAAAAAAAGTARPTRPSTSCWSRWTASAATSGCS